MERAYHIWSLRVSTCHSSLFSKHFICWKTLKVVQFSVWLIVSAASPAKSDFTLLWDDLFNYCRADLQSHQIIISPIPSIPDFVHIHFAQKNYLNQLMHVYTPILHVLHSIYKALWQSTHAWVYVKKCAKYFKWRTHYKAWQLHLDICFKPCLPYGF